MRDYGIPSRVGTFASDAELSALRRRHGDVDIYASVYDRADAESYQSAVVDRIFFDIEFPGTKSRPPEPFLALLRSQAYRLLVLGHGLGAGARLVDSGRGFHVYLFLDQPASLEDNRKALRAVSQALIAEAGVAAADRAVIGDVARIARLPGTINSKTGTECRVVAELERTGPCLLRLMLESYRDPPQPLVPNANGGVSACELFDRLLTDGAGQGKRNASAVFLASRMRRWGWTEPEASSALRAWGTRCSPPVSDDGPARTAEQVYRRDEPYSACGALADRAGSCATCPRNRRDLTPPA